MLSVVTWLWRPPSGFRSEYTTARVNTLYRMVARHYPHPFRRVCVTDMPDGLDANVEVVPLWRDHHDVPSPREDQSHPACYVRLKAFAPEMAKVLGERFVSIDIDSVIVGDLTPLFHRHEDFVIWQPYVDPPEKKYHKQTWNGSLWMMTAGARSDVWDTFNGGESARFAVKAGFYPADQGYFQYMLRGRHEATWTPSAGVISFADMRRHKAAHLLPPHARIVFFNGPLDPWMPEAGMEAPWIAQHYR